MAVAYGTGRQGSESRGAGKFAEPDNNTRFLSRKDQEGLCHRACL